MPGSDVDREGTILDLTRRVALLEQRLYGHTEPACGTSLLVRCYIEAHGVTEYVATETASAWVAQAYLWDVRTLIRLGRAVSDPYPFRPLIAALDACVIGGNEHAKAALTHLEGVSADLLRAQGLELIEPRDLMHSIALGDALRCLPGPKEAPGPRSSKP